MATQVIASDGRPDGIMSFHHFSHGRSLRGGKMSIYPEAHAISLLPTRQDLSICTRGVDLERDLGNFSMQSPDPTCPATFTYSFPSSSNQAHLLFCSGLSDQLAVVGIDKSVNVVCGDEILSLSPLGCFPYSSETEETFTVAYKGGLPEPRVKKSAAKLKNYCTSSQQKAFYTFDYFLTYVLPDSKHQQHHHLQKYLPPPARIDFD
ncbi:hypothetical protein Fcan01_21568 [Folsomia candida]|uniref:Uncharacterized protein n=1 Tax=Folsomia candida TaxID=158441 RepID=A0A226DEP7_FOLCA|nr:hypothetical protein Fcan01_21568 [Folsomia candida]